jgi:hypothetical protein
LLTSNISADTFRFILLLKEAADNEFKTPNLAVIASVINEMKRIRDTKARPRERKPNQALKKERIIFISM